MSQGWLLILGVLTAGGLALLYEDRKKREALNRARDTNAKRRARRSASRRKK